MRETMRKIVIVSTVIFLVSPAAFAETGGPIKCTGKGKFALSYYNNYIPEQRMRQDKYSAEIITDGTTTIWNETNSFFYNINLKIERYFFKLNYGVLDNLDAFLKTGSQRVRVNYEEYDTDNSYIARFIGDYEPFLAGGINTNLFSIGKLFDIGFQAQYLWSKGRVKVWNYETVAARQYQNDVMASDTKYHSWDAALYFYKPFKFAMPYLGARYLYSTYTLKGEFILRDISTTYRVDPLKVEQDMLWIIFGGCDFHINDRLDANIELGGIGSRSVSFGLSWKF